MDKFLETNNKGRLNQEETDNLNRAITLLYTRSYHYIVNQLYFNLKKKEGKK